MTGLPIRTVALLVGMLMGSAAIPCSSCIKDVLPAEEFDRRSWESAEHVFVALVVASQLIEGLDEVEYSLRVEEEIKGTARGVRRVYSSAQVTEWDGDLQEIGCGHLRVSVGDRLLVFSDASGVAPVGRCTSSRVIGGAAAPVPAEVDRTIDRLREWAR